jgi:hypothetical protein
MNEKDLATQYDGIAHVITIDFTKNDIAICCSWSAVAGSGCLEFFPKPVALMSA